MDHHVLHIQRGVPAEGREPTSRTYQVPKGEYRKVLEALAHIYENQDSTLAFRMGCRYKTCGLCAMQIDGKPKIACLTELKDEMTIGPLKNLPVVRDLVIDRRVFFQKLREYELFLPEEKLSELPRLKIPPSYRHLAQCRECLCCVAAHEPYQAGAAGFESLYIFVKLAQLHFDPRNRLDRKEQARELGIEHYRQVKAIPCPFGISIIKEAIRPLMDQGA